MGIFTDHFTIPKSKCFLLASIIAVVVLILSTPYAQGKTVSAEEALQRVMETASLNNKTLSFKASPRLVYTMSICSTQRPGLYVFTPADNRGFIIVSADDDARALLGYSEIGSFAPENIPPQMEYLLDCYTNEIASLDQQRQPNSKVNGNDSDKHLAPLLKSMWSQMSPYNMQCPGVFSPVGSTATALAQIMRYFNYPEKGEGYTVYNWGDEFVSSEFSKHTYDWDNMLDSYKDNYNYTQSSAVSLLMRDCTVAVHTDFGIEYSTAQPREILKALVDYFGYDPQVRYMEREYYSLSEWEEAIYNQLDNHGPALYVGYSDNNHRQHAFVCDGYAGEYFHINWGWGGISDGYFLLSALDPPTHGVGGGKTGYNWNQILITNIYPNEGGDYWIELVSNASFEIREASVNLGDFINFDCTLFNLSTVTFQPVVGLAFTNTNDNQTIFTTGFKTNTDLPPLVLLGPLSDFHQKLPSDLSDGTYIVRPAYQDLSGQWHILPVSMSKTREYTMTVKDNTATFLANEAPIPFVEASEILTPIYSSGSFKCSVTLNNPSTEEFFGEIYPCFLTEDSKFYKTTELNVSLRGQENKQIEFVTTCDIEPGQYEFCYCITSPENPSEYRIISSKIEITVNPIQNVVPQVTDLHFANDNLRNVNATDITFTFDATLKDGIYQNPLYLCLYSQGELIHAFPSQPLFLEEGLNPDITLTYDISERVKKGERYYINLCAYVKGNYKATSYLSYEITIGSLTRIDNITEEPCIVSTTYFTLNGTSLNGTPSTAGIYIKKEKQTNGKVNVSKVIVK